MDFEAQRDSDSGEVKIYSYLYAEYEDFFDNQYNLILVYFHIYKTKIIDKVVNIITSKRGIEKYRWDIGLD